MKTTFIIVFLLSLSSAFAQGSNDGVHAYLVGQKNGRKVTSEWMAIAESYKNVRESGGANRGKEVNMFLASVGLNPGYSWCMAFQQFCFIEACRQACNTPRGDLAKGASVMQVYNLTKARARLLPQSYIGKRGSMMCFQHGRTALGHVALVLGKNSDGSLLTIEGNTGPDGGRDGDGVYYKHRPVNGYRTLATKGFFVLVQ